MHFQKNTLGFTNPSGEMNIMQSEEAKDICLWSDLVIEQVLMNPVKSCGGLSIGKDMDGNTITIWIHSIHLLAGIHCFICSLGQIHETSEQHVEQREYLIKQDLVDLATLQDWFEDHSPFSNFTELIAHSV